MPADPDRRPVPLALVLVFALVLALSLASAPAVARADAAGPSTVAGPSAGTTRPSTGTPGSPAGNASSALDPEIVRALPDPVAADDRGEYVAVDVPAAGNWSLTDGESAASLPPGRLAVSPDPNATASLTDRRVVAADLALANGGERLVLRRDGRPVSVLAYERAREGELLVDTGDGTAWRPRGFEPREPVALGSTTATAFVLPDAPEPAFDALAGAEDRLLLAAYTLTSRRTADALLAAERRGADVRVLVEGGPVGGVGGRQAALLDRLVAGGVAVRVVDGPRAPVRYHHAKYAVADDRAVVLTENWKPAGVGGRGSRGWGVRLGGRAADALSDLFADDYGGPGTVRWAAFREGRTFRNDSAADARYPSAFDPARLPVRNATVLTAPGNARPALVDRIDGADERVLVLQPTVAGPDDPLVRAAVRAARRGVEVRLLLSGAWYVESENRALVDRLDRRAEREGVPLSARVADPGGRYAKVHAKGVVVDDAVALGSLNWNGVSATENREVVVVLAGERVADYYARVFDADWRGGRRRFPTLLALGAGGAVVVAVLVGRRRLSFA